jgi:hypothetical protein
MLSARLIQRIESNWEAIAGQVIAQVRRDNEVSHYQSLSESEIRERARDIVVNLGYWLLSNNTAEIASRYEALGRRRFREGVPLHEVVYKLAMIRKSIGNYVMEQNLSLSAMEVYEELELLRSLTRFFDQVVHNLVRGYETELREVQRNGTLHPFQVARVG